MTFPKWLVDFYIRYTKESGKKATKELIIDRHTENYNIPKYLRFPRPIIKNDYLEMEIFESHSNGKSKWTLLYFHGGSYIHKFSPFHWRFLSKIAKMTGCALVVPNYFMMPKWSAKISNEITMNYYEAFTRTHDMSKVVIAGDSAGGGLALVIMQRAIKMGLPLPAKAILISPWVDVTGGNPEKDRVDNMISYDVAMEYGKAWQKGLKDKDPFASPLYGDMAGLPPVDLWVGGNEVLFYDIMFLFMKMKDNNVQVKLHQTINEGHVFPLYPTRNGKNARKEIAEFILNETNIKSKR